MSITPDDIVSMIYFARVVEETSFTRAASRLGVSKSVVSERVSALEARFHVRLMNRTTRKLSLTPEGLALYQRCLRLIAAADDAFETADTAGDVPNGTLRVDAPTGFAEDHLLAPIAGYLERYPGVRVELGTRDHKIDLVAEGIDLAVRITPRLEDSSLVVRKLAVDHTVLCASPSYLAARGEPQKPEDLMQHSCIIYSVLKVSHEWRFHDERGKEAPVPLSGRLSAETGALLRRAALAGIGLCVMPRSMIASDLDSGRLVTVLDKSFASVELGVYAVYPATRRPSLKVRAFVDALVKHFRRPRW